MVSSFQPSHCRMAVGAPQHRLIRERLEAIGCMDAEPLPDFAAMSGAREAWRADARSFTPWVWAAFEVLPDASTQARMEARLGEASPSGAFLLWMVDHRGYELLVVHQGESDGRWEQQNRRNGSMPHLGELLVALGQTAPFPVRTARVAQLLGRKQLTHRFYKDVQEATFRVARSWRSNEAMSDEDRHELALLLVARTMFLHFVQAKNWLPHSQFLQQICQVDDPSLYRKYWQPLFFDALNLPADERVSGVIPDSVPYLNGGLFAPSDLEHRYPDLDLPNDALRHLVVEVLARYAFVDDEHEGTPRAIAPHLLGEIFERLMEPEERQVTGAFYTPSTLANALWAESFDAWLRDIVGEQLAEKVVQRAQLCCEEAEVVFDRLWHIRVLDPAVGTGAFLLSALQGLEQVLLYVLTFLPGRSIDRRSLREHLVTHALHGIDIQRNAVLLAELRLWLAVTAASQNCIHAATPLPNLAHRLRVGNALLSPSWTRDHALPENLVAKREHLGRLLARFPTLRGRERSDCMKEIQDMEQALTIGALTHRVRVLKTERLAQTSLFAHALPPTMGTEETALRQHLQASGAWHDGNALDPALHFADVMQEGGFDIVIGNPPWGRLSLLDRSMQTRLRRRYHVLQPNGGRQASPDMSVAFFEAYFPLLKPTGYLAFLFPSKTLRAGWGGAWRAWVHRASYVHTLRELSTDSNHGFHASVYPCVCVMRPKRVGDRVDKHPLLRLRQAPTILPSASNQAWRPRYGVKTGYNRAFLVGLDSTLPHTVPVVRGKDIRAGRYACQELLLFPHDPHTGYVLPMIEDAVMQHLSPHKACLEARSDMREGMPWWTLFRVRADMLGWRVAWRDVAQRLEAVVLPPVAQGGPVNLNSTYAIACTSQDEADSLCQWLNRDQTTDALIPYAQRARNGYYRFDARLVGMANLPPG